MNTFRISLSINRNGKMFFELTVVDFASEFQHSGFVPFHSHVDDRTGISGRRTLVFDVNFQQELPITAVEVKRLFKYNCRGTLGVHYQ